MLSSLRGFYDDRGRLLLPPIKPGEGLPQKLHDAYSKEKELKQLRQLQQAAETTSQPPSDNAENQGDSYVSVEQCQEESDEVKAEAGAVVAVEGGRVGGLVTVDQAYDGSCSRITSDAGIVLPQDLDLKASPVSEAVVEVLANHMGIDLSPEAREAENRRGAAFVVHGAASSGRTTQAVAVGVAYGAPVLQLDAVLEEAISSASTSGGRKARDLCLQAMVAKSVESSEPPAPATASSKRQQQQQQVAAVSLDPPITPFPPVPFFVEPHEDKEYAVPGRTLTPTHLPEDLMVEILARRLQEEDCLRGVVLDGIDSQFTSSQLVSLAVILRAFNNRTHLYFVHLNLDLQVIKERMEELDQLRLVRVREEEELRREAERKEEQRIEGLLNIDEDEYELLTEEQREEVDAICLMQKKKKREERLRKKEEERLEKLRKEEAERQQKEQEKSKKKGKKGQKSGLQGLKTQMPAPGGISRPESATSVYPQTSQGQPLGGVATTSGVSLISSVDSPNMATTPRHRTTKRKGSAVKAMPLPESDEEGTKLERQYWNYKSALEGVRVLLEDWDREKGVARPRKTPESEEPKPTPTRRSKAFKQKEVEAMLAVAQEAEENREGLGVPCIEVRACESLEEVTAQILGATELPNPQVLLSELGLGPDGPPIPGSFTFQVCPFPLKRRAHEDLSEVYSFIASSFDDP